MTHETFRIAPGGGKLYPFNGIWPTLAEGAYIAPGARIIGDVHIGAKASIWFNCVLRGDVNKIRVGAGSNIQDNTVVHVEGGGAATLIGEDVLIGHSAMIHGTIIEDRGFVGLGAVTMDGGVIESEGMVAAGALLSPGKRVASRELWVGRPAKKIRDLDDKAIAGMQEGVVGYQQLAAQYLKDYLG
ncbi:gamma carbonic anhydrase family protein [Paremcibacter congregatus]|uniref:Gamma carbonic anhydrase family protein n=1 Tax=Paremcibacter congregatus TaxID=2043170 RepID=A0A2G4YLW7_9PROT|nr:gamma carbonic anhydrase family protein [Paremcibacter congregatus]PHZ83310.1 gamma carbonic anhydrase family protein [Paremcibacter congregatus]QDE28216.1 gamma carbonic anhydrase family protein [Paremcibacter congregatus]